jgi:hypothetical protein
LLALPGLWLLRREWTYFPALVYGLVLFFGVALVFPVSSMSGTFERSLGVVMPFLALAAMYALQQAVKPFRRHQKVTLALSVGIVIALLAMAGYLVSTDLSVVADRQQRERAQMDAVAGWLARNANPADVIMTPQTYSLNYASGHPTIALPGNEPPDAAWDAARRYRARYLVLTETFGGYPQILQDTSDPRFKLVAELEAIQIYAIGGGQP